MNVSIRRITIGPLAGGERTLVEVSFGSDSDPFTPQVDVAVYVDSRERSLAELQDEAVRKARAAAATVGGGA